MKIYVPRLLSEKYPTIEGCYMVSNGFGWFEVQWHEQYGFHAEFTDCSGVTMWLESVELPDPLTIETEGEKQYPYRKEADNAGFYNEGFEDGAKYILKQIKNVE